MFYGADLGNRHLSEEDMDVWRALINAAGFGEGGGRERVKQREVGMRVNVDLAAPPPGLLVFFIGLGFR